MAPPNIKKMITIKMKPRKDPYSDQFSRIFMVKILMLTATITGISWAKDKFNCIVPKHHGLSAGFVGKACWINGIYIYKNLPKSAPSFYYGIPEDVSLDGINTNEGTACDADSPGVKNCEPLEKTFYLQYQWFPFCVAALGIMYYLPYLLYCLVNADLLGIKDQIKNKKKDEINYSDIVDRFFLRKNNSSSMLNSRILLNVVVKVIYVVTNIVGLIIIDAALNGEFISYGSAWSDWLGSSSKHDYTNTSRDPKAGHALLPAFGICQVQDSALDAIRGSVNKHTFVCEMSQHVLYQYILIILWYVVIAGIIVSILGLLKHVFDGISSLWCAGIDGQHPIYSTLLLRERQYLDYVRRKNMTAYGELIKHLMLAKGMRNRNPSTSSSDPVCDSKKKLMEEE